MKKFAVKSYRISIYAFAHIIERHYHKTLRHPGTGKFNIPLATILDYLKDAARAEALPIKGSMNLQRILCLAEPIGTNKAGEPAYKMLVITDHSENIITASPPTLNSGLKVKESAAIFKTSAATESVVTRAALSAILTKLC